MSQSIVFVGIDVDDVRYHGSALNPSTGEILEFDCRPTMKGLFGQLEKVREYFGEALLKLCYEASHVGFSLQRDLQDRGYDCAVVVPSSIPRRQCDFFTFPSRPIHDIRAQGVPSITPSTDEHTGACGYAGFRLKPRRSEMKKMIAAIAIGLFSIAAFGDP
jgi:hypothetical protein